MNKPLLITFALALTLVIGIYAYVTNNNNSSSSTTQTTNNVQTAPAPAVIEQNDDAAVRAREEKMISERQRKLRESAESIR